MFSFLVEDDRLTQIMWSTPPKQIWDHVMYLLDLPPPPTQDAIAHRHQEVELHFLYPGSPKRT